MFNSLQVIFVMLNVSIVPNVDAIRAGKCEVECFEQVFKSDTYICENLAARAHQWEQIWV
jgi:hypothetical protein